MWSRPLRKRTVGYWLLWPSSIRLWSMRPRSNRWGIGARVNLISGIISRVIYGPTKTMLTRSEEWSVSTTAADAGIKFQVAGLLVALLLITGAAGPELVQAGVAPHETGSINGAPAGCKLERAVTAPAPVNLDQVLSDLYALRDAQSAPIFPHADGTLRQEVAALFDLATPKSKLEQFYRLLYEIARFAASPADAIEFDVTTVRQLLLSSGVFSDPALPGHIIQVHLDRRDRTRPRYRVTFDAPEVRLPLNGGQGFGVVRQGMCQHAKALVFYGSFAFSMAMPDRDLQVTDFENLDLWGTFGVRGIATIDLNYIAVKSVEFVQGTPLGLVRAQVSRREFQVNDHSALLDLITRFVTNTSLQPIDW